MNKREKIETVFLYIVFGFYILFLLKLLLLSRVSLAEVFSGQRETERAINLIPFYSIKEYLAGSTAAIRNFSYANVAGNIAVFIPLGAYLLLFKKDKRVLPNLLFVFIISLSTELIQGFFFLGSADVDDLILNCLGGLIGIFGYKLVSLLFKEEKKVRIAFAVVSAMGLPVLLYYLFMIKLRL